MGRFTYLLMAMAGVFGVSAAVVPTARLVSMLRSVGSAPVEARVADAPVGRWVTLTDAKLRCDTRATYKDAMTFFLATDAGTAHPFVAQFVGVVSCEAASAAVSGAFVAEPMTMADLAQYGIDARGATGLRLFTQGATPKYLRPALVPLGGILLIGAAIAFFGFRGLLRAKRAGK